MKIQKETFVKIEQQIFTRGIMKIVNSGVTNITHSVPRHTLCSASRAPTERDDILIMVTHTTSYPYRGIKRP